MHKWELPGWEAFRGVWTRCHNYWMSGRRCNFDYSLQTWKGWAGEMAQWLRALAALAEKSGLVPSAHEDSICKSRCREFSALFWPLWVLHMLGAHPFMQANTHTNKTERRKCQSSQVQKAPLSRVSGSLG